MQLLIKASDKCTTAIVSYINNNLDIKTKELLEAPSK